jgi:hypothetical protein
MSTGRRIFAVVSIVLSVVVLLLSVAGIIGTWWAYRPVIDVSTGVLEGVDQLAQVGREGIARLDTRLTELREVAVEVEEAADQVAQNVADKGLILTLLPPEKEQELQASAQQIADGLASFRDVVAAVIDLIDAVGQVPFVNLPEPDPERVAGLDEGISSIRASVTELETDIRQFREGAGANISEISAAAAEIDQRLGAAQENLAQVDGELARLQSDTGQLKERIPTLVTTAAVVITLLLAWSGYAMVVLIQQAWSGLRSGGSQ